jgi:hypothetical protein
VPDIGKHARKKGLQHHAPKHKLLMTANAAAIQCADAAQSIALLGVLRILSSALGAPNSLLLYEGTDGGSRWHPVQVI